MQRTGSRRVRVAYCSHERAEVLSARAQRRWPPGGIRSAGVAEREVTATLDLPQDNPDLDEESEEFKDVDMGKLRIDCSFAKVMAVVPVATVWKTASNKVS